MGRTPLRRAGTGHVLAEGTGRRLPGNIWVVAVGAGQYAPLANAGFVPLHLCPWDRPQVRDFLTRLPTPENFPLEQATEDLTQVLKKTGSLLDVALSAGWLLENGAVPPKRTDPFRQRLEKWAGGFPDLPPLEGVEPPTRWTPCASWPGNFRRTVGSSAPARNWRNSSVRN